MISNNNKIILSILFMLSLTGCATNQGQIASSHQQAFTIIHEYNPAAVAQQSKNTIHNIVATLQDASNTNEKIIRFAKKVKNTPYSTVGATGESDLCPGHAETHGCIHIQQDPIYRTDTFDCATLVNVGLASIFSNDTLAFNHRILQVSYGAAGLPYDHIRYFNRNNFISADFNPVNQRNGFLRDATRDGNFVRDAKTKTTIIDHQKWFRYQQKSGRLHKNIRVLDPRNGLAMRERFLTDYPPNYFLMQKRHVNIDYIPKQIFVRCNAQGCIPNEERIAQLPQPSVVEIIRDDKHWNLGGRNIRKVIGSGINVSHLGFLYHQNFQQGEIIYQRIACATNNIGEKSCDVTPIVCHRAVCHETMFLHATSAYPNGFFWSEHNGRAFCTADASHTGTTGPCNRVVAMPLSAYILQSANHRTPFLGDSSILGIHIEKIHS